MSDRPRTAASDSKSDRLIRLNAGVRLLTLEHRRKKHIRTISYLLPSRDGCNKSNTIKYSSKKRRNQVQSRRRLRCCSPRRRHYTGRALTDRGGILRGCFSRCARWSGEGSDGVVVAARGFPRRTQTPAWVAEGLCDGESSVVSWEARGSRRPRFPSPRDAVGVEDGIIHPPEHPSPRPPNVRPRPRRRRRVFRVAELPANGFQRRGREKRDASN